MKFSIVIPVFNESKNLPLLINQIYKILKSKKFELIIVDDNSNDDTSVVLKKFKKKNFHHLVRKSERDLSQSCFHGFDKAKYENIIVMDGDLQHPPRYIKKLLKVFFYKKVDVVIGSRNLLNKRGPGLSLFRYLSSIFIIQVINLFLENKTSDPLSGFFVFKKKIYKKNKKKLFGKGYKILADLIYSTSERLRILDYEIYFDSRKSGKSKMNLLVILQLVIFIIKSFILKWKIKI